MPSHRTTTKHDVITRLPRKAPRQADVDHTVSITSAPFSTVETTAEKQQQQPHHCDTLASSDVKEHISTTDLQSTTAIAKNKQRTSMIRGCCVKKFNTFCKVPAKK